MLVVFHVANTFQPSSISVLSKALAINFLCSFICLVPICVTMVFEYRSLELSTIDEKQPSRPSSDSSATLHALDDLDFLSQNSELDLYKAPICQPTGIWLRSKWLWAIHGILLFTSCGILAVSLIARSTTLDHVRRFSAWCEYSFWKK